VAAIVIYSLNQSTSGALSDTLERLQHSVFEVSTLPELQEQIKSSNIDVVFINAQTNGASGIEALKELDSFGLLRCTPVVVISSEVNSDHVIEAMRLGAFDHLYKFSDLDEVVSVIARAVARPKTVLGAADVMQQPGDLILGISPAMRQVEKLIGIAATSNAAVLVQGATGTGKDTVARAIYKYGKHVTKTLSVIDCTAVPEDYESFESISANSKGTVLLDEIGDLNAQMQAMLVRALKESASKPIATAGGVSADNLRIIATTQYDLINMVREKRFREDLYYRLNVLSIVLPPLRERGSDIIALAENFLYQARPDAPKRLSSAAVKVLLDHDWPGNVRELQNLMYHLSVVVRSRIIEESDLSMIRSVTAALDKSAVVAGSESRVKATSSSVAGPDSTGLDSTGLDCAGLDYYQAVSALERSLLTRALAQSHGSRAEAARLLGINRQLLYAKLKAHGLMDE